jgi:hypothetical protein
LYAVFGSVPGIMGDLSREILKAADILQLILDGANP